MGESDASGAFEHSTVGLCLSHLWHLHSTSTGGRHLRHVPLGARLRAAARVRRGGAATAEHGRGARGVRDAASSAAGGSTVSTTFQFDVFDDHPIGTLHIVRPCAIRGLQTKALSHAPKYGEHTFDVLGCHPALAAGTCPLSHRAKSALARQSPVHSPVSARLVWRLRRPHQVSALWVPAPPTEDGASVSGAGVLAWRQGDSRGARDMERVLRPEPDVSCLSRARSAPCRARPTHSCDVHALTKVGVFRSTVHEAQ